RARSRPSSGSCRPPRSSWSARPACPPSSPTSRRTVEEPVSIDRGAGKNGLALLIARLLEENLASDPARCRQLRRLRAVVGLRATDAGVAVTLAFRGGHLTLYDGLRGDADVVIEARGEQLVQLALISVWRGYPHVLDSRGRALTRDLL